ncbi:MAG: ECF-type sigma factor [Holophagales bacterium]|nr:ECF-type sigma factor [Holophagales bacterium]
MSDPRAGGSGGGDVTELLRAWSDGDGEALDQLLPLVLEDARAIARNALVREGRNRTLEPTELVNEAYLRLVDRRTHWWRDRLQFFSCLAELMRRILVDRARRRKASKRGFGVPNLSLEETIFLVDDPHPDLVLLDDALEALKTIDPRKYQVILLWFFVGLTQQEMAREMGISVNTVAREWQAARVWLRHQVSRSGEAPDEPGDD